jgi:hypothetical protein
MASMKSRNRPSHDAKLHMLAGTLVNEKCWKHDHVLIKGDGLVDSTMIDKVNELLPPNWEIFQFQDRITLDDGDYYFILINNQFSFIDSIYSTTDKLKPEITIAIFDKKYERKLKMDLKNKLNQQLSSNDAK